MAHFLKNFPMTEAGKKLNLSDEMKNMFRVVYKKDKEEGKWLFYDLWNVENKYDDDCIILPFQSTYDELELVEKGTEFANIIESSKDPKHNCTSWIQLMKAVYKEEGLNKQAHLLEQCCTDGKYYGKEEVTKTCSTKVDNIIGGHVLIGVTKAERLTPGVAVELLPICKQHNSKTMAPAKENGAGFYMKTRYNINAIKLRGYMQSELISEYLLKNSLELEE